MDTLYKRASQRAIVRDISASFALSSFFVLLVTALRMCQNQFQVWINLHDFQAKLYFKRVLKSFGNRWLKYCTIVQFWYGQRNICRDIIKLSWVFFTHLCTADGFKVIVRLCELAPVRLTIKQRTPLSVVLRSPRCKAHQ